LGLATYLYWLETWPERLATWLGTWGLV